MKKLRILLFGKIQSNELDNWLKYNPKLEPYVETVHKTGIKESAWNYINQKKVNTIFLEPRTKDSQKPIDDEVIRFISDVRSEHAGEIVFVFYTDAKKAKKEFENSYPDFNYDSFIKVDNNHDNLQYFERLRYGLERCDAYFSKESTEDADFDSEKDAADLKSPPQSWWQWVWQETQALPRWVRNSVLALGGLCLIAYLLWQSIPNEIKNKWLQGSANTALEKPPPNEIDYDVRVMNIETKKFISNATVILRSQEGFTDEGITDDKGFYRAKLKTSGSVVTLRVEAEGYSIQSTSFPIPPNFRDVLLTSLSRPIGVLTNQNSTPAPGITNPAPKPNKTNNPQGQSKPTLTPGTVETTAKFYAGEMTLEELRMRLRMDEQAGMKLVNITAVSRSDGEVNQVEFADASFEEIQSELILLELNESDFPRIKNEQEAKGRSFICNSEVFVTTRRTRIAVFR